MKKNRQSKDFNEIWNVQTDMNVSKKRWDSIFHNWKDPKNCATAKNIGGCAICEELKNKGFVIRSNGEICSVNLLIVGDVHSDYINLQKLIDDNKDCFAVVCVGDLALWKEEEGAKLDKSAYSKTSENIKKFISDPIKFNKPVYVVSGNHDDFDNMYSDYFKNLNIHYLPKFGIKEFNNTILAFLGGIFSSKKIDFSAKELVGRENRFFTKEELKLLSNFKDKNITHLITHQASTGVLPKEYTGKDQGSIYLKNLIDILKPFYYIHGHHHINYRKTINDGTTVVGIGNFLVEKNSYIKINTLINKII